jgi:calcium-dependent protein kinase
MFYWQRLVLAQVIADHLSAEEVEDIKEMFKVMDTDNDGKVSYEELKSGIAKFGSHLAESEVQMLIESVSNLKVLSGLLN